MDRRSFSNKRPSKPAIFVRFKEFVRSKAVEKISSERMAIFVGLIILVLVTGGILLFRHDRARQAATVQKSPDVMAEDMPGWWYRQYFGSSVCDKESCKPQSDPDNDKLSNAQEWYYRSNPVSSDTNQNGKTDGQDVAAGIDPSLPGEKTFEDAMSEDQIFGESMVYADTIKKEFSQSANPNNVVLTLAEESTLKISADNSKKAIDRYQEEVSAVVEKYLIPDNTSYYANVASSGDMDAILEAQKSAIKGNKELLGLVVPSSYIKLHKYFLRYFELLGQILYAPPESLIQDSYNPAVNLWSDNVKEFLVLVDRITAEAKLLNLPLNFSQSSVTK